MTSHALSKTAKRPGWRKSLNTGKSEDLKAAARELKKQGRRGDSDVVHVNSQEKRMLKRYGGSGSTNPKTGLKEYYGDNVGGPSTRDAPGGGRADNGGPDGGKSSGSSDNNAQKSVPTASRAPLAKGQALSPGGALGGASGSDSLGDQGDASAAASMGARPMDQYHPGDVPAVKGADAVGIGARVLGGIGGAVASGLSQAFTGEDKTRSLLGDEHFGKQVGWSSGGDETGTRPGKTDKGNMGSAVSSAGEKTSDASTTTSSSTSSSSGGSSFVGGQTLTVNPDGTVRTQDTSIAGLRAKRRYGAKTTGAIA